MEGKSGTLFVRKIDKDGKLLLPIWVMKALELGCNDQIAIYVTNKGEVVLRNNWRKEDENKKNA